MGHTISVITEICMVLMYVLVMVESSKVWRWGSLS